jgi:hypothetical protein
MVFESIAIDVSRMSLICHGFVNARGRPEIYELLTVVKPLRNVEAIVFRASAVRACLVITGMPDRRSISRLMVREFHL